MNWLQKILVATATPEEIEQELDRFNKPTGDCFAIAGKAAVETGGTLVHGMVTHPLSKKTYWHAWVEKDGQVIDNSINLTCPIKKYYQIMNADPKAKYQGLSWMGKHLHPSGHWGPWQ